MAASPGIRPIAAFDARIEEVLTPFRDAVERLITIPGVSRKTAQAILAEVGPDMLIVTPGIRLAGGEAGDQARVMTPGKAIAAGADCLVVGRPITEAADPRAVAEAFVKEIAGALQG